MSKNIQDLIDISRYYGNLKEYVIAGGGNTSFKNEEKLWVKASGTALSTIDAKGFAILERDSLKKISQKKYSDDALEREQQVKIDLYKSLEDPTTGIRPSVETSMHDIIDYSYVVHTHPTLVNSITCSKNAKSTIINLFGDEALYIPYTDPGYILFKKVEESINSYKEEFQQCPKIIFLQNHGVFVSANDTDEIKQIYAAIEDKIKEHIKNEIEISDVEIESKILDILPAIRMKLSAESLKTCTIRNNSLIDKYISNYNEYRNIAHPFTPDIVVYCKSKFLYIESDKDAESILNNFKHQLEKFREEYGYDPKIILIKGLGIIGVEDTYKSAEIVLDVFEDLIKISHYSQNFGGPNFMTPDQIEFIDNWEVENYRRKISKGSSNTHPVKNKIAIVTGGAQGFGGGIVEKLISQNANVVIADINDEKGIEYAEELNKNSGKSTAYFVKTNVADSNSVENLMIETVKRFGGLDIFVSNAGVLRAGGIDELDVESFEFMTKINYTGYFICSKHASSVMKLQHQFNRNHFMDIIQINSKSGLKGSNKNFAYAGGKFGGIGLTQSFALELVTHNIKVNSICPGNFFDGPLWADSDKGLFVQYLNAGKIPGAKSIEEVKKFYEKQVPMNRGCNVDDVMEALYYIINQKYETGQAVPVTGGQIMLS